MAGGMKLLGALRADEMIADAKAAIAWLRQRKDVRGDRIGAMGFCIGGHMTYLTACETDVRAAASFYGGGIAGAGGAGRRAVHAQPHRRRSGASSLGLFGAKDGLIPKSQVDAIRAELAKHGVRHEVVVYPDADHGFFCDQRATYQKAAAEDAWKRVKQLFREELAGLRVRRGHSPRLRLRSPWLAARFACSHYASSRRSAESSDSTEVSRAFSPIRPIRQIWPASGPSPPPTSIP